MRRHAFFSLSFPTSTPSSSQRTTTTSSTHPLPPQGITADTLLAAPARAAAGAAADLLDGAAADGSIPIPTTATEAGALGDTYVRGADPAALAAAEAEAEAARFIERELAARTGRAPRPQGEEGGGGTGQAQPGDLFAVPSALRGQAAEAGPRVEAYMTGVVEVDVGQADRLAALEAAEAARRAALGLGGGGGGLGGGGGGSGAAPRAAFPKAFGAGKRGRR